MGRPGTWSSDCPVPRCDTVLGTHIPSCLPGSPAVNNYLNICLAQFGGSAPVARWEVLGKSSLVPLGPGWFGNNPHLPLTHRKICARYGSRGAMMAEHHMQWLHNEKHTPGAGEIPVVKGCFCRGRGISSTIHTTAHNHWKLPVLGI